MGKIKHILTLFLILTLVITTTSCGKNNEQDNSGDDDEVLNIEHETQALDMSNLGITMELSGDFADCRAEVFSDSEINSIVKGACKGFKLIKEIAGEEHIIANILIVESKVATDPQVRSQFPYIYSGDQYTVLVNAPKISGEALDSELAARIENGLIEQVTTMFFDEDKLISSMGGTVTEESTDDVSNEQIDSVDTSIESTDNYESTDEIIEETDNTEIHNTVESTDKDNTTDTTEVETDNTDEVVD